MPARIIVEGLGDIAPAAIWPMVDLQSASQGQSLISTIAIRDLGIHPTAFLAGKRVTVDLGPGQPALWSGYILVGSRRFFFDVDNPDAHQRQWILTLADINYLFTKRFTLNKAHPEKVEGPMYKSETYDDDVVKLLCSDWLDLSFDDLDVTSGVERVASIYYGQATNPWSAGASWRDAMDSISQLPASVYYIDPDRKLIYTDAGTESAPFSLSDHPDASQRGYRMFTEWEDGTQFCNDGYAWGFGKGANHGVFRRVSDDDSIEAHGLWQDASVITGIYKQETIDKVADSIVNGSPSSRRGRRNPIHSIDLTTDADGLRVGQKVRVIEGDLDIVLPIRRAKITFASPERAQYSLHLSEAVDKWGFMDPPLPFHFWGYGFGGVEAGTPSCTIDSFNGRTGSWAGATDEEGFPTFRVWQDPMLV